MPQIQLQVSIDEAHARNLSPVVERLREAGMKVEQVLDFIGIVTGSADTRQMDALATIEGVSSVEPSETYQIAPPESPVQ